MRRLVLIAGLLLAAVRVYGDSWLLLEQEAFHSADGQWRLTITPKQLDDQLEYFAGRVADCADAGAADGVNADAPRGELFRKHGGGTWQRVVRWRLVNEVAPVSALVANDGTVVTFDNWHSAGYGDDVVVIYRPDGSLVRKLGLADLMDDEDIWQLRRTVSSIWWAGTHHIDEEKRIVVLAIVAYKQESVPISLTSGTVLVPRRAMFPRPRVTWIAEDVGAGTCHGAVALLPSEFVSRALAADPPAYPAVARKARVAGTVIVDISIDLSGAVDRAEIVKPLPFGLDRAAYEAVLAWRFRPVERAGQALSMCGRVKFRYELTSSSIVQ